MEIICGKQTILMDHKGIQERANQYQELWLDIGTGDGRFVTTEAHRNPKVFVVGLDSCRENLVKQSRASTQKGNSLFIIANALALPKELTNLVTRATINFPWGSLLDALLWGDSSFFTGLIKTSVPGASIDIRINLSAVEAAGLGLEESVTRICQSFEVWGFYTHSITPIGRFELQSCPSTWAKKMAFSRNPYGFHIMTKR